MLWTAISYVAFNILLYIIYFFLKGFFYLGQPVVPYYWDPHTLFNLARFTGMFGIEDIIFLFAIGIVVTGVYECLYGKKIILKKSYRPHLIALIVSFLSFFILAYFLKSNLIYPYIISTLLGAVSIYLERPDLIKHSLIGGVSFVISYAIFFLIFLIIFPDFIKEVYHVENLSGIIIAGLPFEEYLYAFTFGLMWAPLYEYAHGEKNKDLK
ncbi:MAG: lycopene cyclase domain-containing protein [Nanoarchaeota archaeon]|nr:lycopene cyclase domain-containing protein [Nanoarchaeota archaeon]